MTTPDGASFIRRSRRFSVSDTTYGLILLSPAAILIGLILVVPIGVAVSMAFLRVDLTRSPDWTFYGLNNFGQLATDPLAAAAIPRTFYFASLTVVGTVIVALGVALLLNETFRFRSGVRIVALIPWAIAPLAAGTTWFLLFYQASGGVNALLHGLGLVPRYVSWLDDATLALHIAIVGQIWLTVPLASLILFARLQSIPKALYRAAMMDGAGASRRFWHVTLPLLRSTLLIIVLIETIISLQTFDLLFALTRGGPALGTVVFNLLIYQRGFVELRLGYAAALALILFAIIVVAAVIVFSLVALTRRRGFRA